MQENGADRLFLFLNGKFGLYHIIAHLSTDNIVRFLFLSSSVNSKAGKKEKRKKLERERLPCIMR